MRVRFLEDYDYKPTRQTTIGYKSGMEMTVKKDCGLKAIEAGKAVEISAPPRSQVSEVPDYGEQ
ncbi:hypothetical protein [Agrobacterium vitis]|uniref:hypothetical protein n=1 Tax=Agrobacterium vitis TaxID=373 RepID=UPI0008DC1CFE|nr:hypothetical protein [Agrobacterium vitis]